MNKTLIIQLKDGVQENENDGVVWKQEMYSYHLERYSQTSRDGSSYKDNGEGVTEISLEEI